MPPHNHTTWAIIAGVHGAERNVVYERLDNGAQEGVVKLREAPAKEKTLRRGDVICYLPDDFHHIETPAGSGDALHLHFYGLSLEHLPDRLSVDMATAAAKRFMARAKILTPLLSVQQVKAMLKSGEVFAFFDVREEGEFSIQGHPLFATPLPLSRLEPRALALLPDPHTRIVLMDSGEDGQDPQWGGRANRAAAKLSQMGYTDLAVMKGGLSAWRAAGCEVFTGVNVPSKAFGEVVEHENDTPRIDAADLQKLVDAKTDLVILDSRPMPEFNNMSIPGGIDCPGAELVYRVKDLVPNPETLVVVNCAGRTRSIIGAQSLINAGLPNKVIALKNGTMGWHLAGLKVARGETRSFGPQGPEAAKFAQAAAANIAARMKVKKIDKAGLAALEAKGGPLYRLDVRDPAEYAKGHLKGFRHAAGGQLVQATDQYVGARHATIVLHDNDGVRATMTAHWLMQMDWNDVYVLDHKPGSSELTTEAEPRFPKGFVLPAPASRRARRAAQVAGARAGDRSRHQPALPRRPRPGRLVRRARQPGKDHSRDAGQAEGRDPHRAGLARRRDRSAGRSRGRGGGRRPAGGDPGGRHEGLARCQARRSRRVTPGWPIRRPTCGTGLMTSKRISKRRCGSISTGRSIWCRRWRVTATRSSRC